MSIRRTVTAALLISFFTAAACNAGTLQDNWNDFLHYTKIGRFDLAKGYAQAILDNNPDAAELFVLSCKDEQGYSIILKVSQSASDAELEAASGKILEIISRGRFARRSEPAIIAAEIRRLSSTERGRIEAVKNLQNAGEYAVPYMLDAMADSSRREELPNIIWALPQIGRDSVRPLVVALQTENIEVRAEVIKALGKIGYTQSLGFLKYIVEKDPSAEMQSLAQESINQIDKSAMTLSAAQLFQRLAEQYYYGAESLAASDNNADFANVWFWDAAAKKLTAEKVGKSYFNSLMAMRCCEWALRADDQFGSVIGLWQAAYFKVESTGLKMPAYFGDRPTAMVYATTAGCEYLYQSLARAVKDKDIYVAVRSIEALEATAGEKSTLSKIDNLQPLVQALYFNDRMVRYSAAIAIASIGPKGPFADSRLVVENLTKAIAEAEGPSDANAPAGDYALRAAQAMLKLATAQNPAIPVADLTSAQDVLINATKGKNQQISSLACQILARLNSPIAQGAIAAMALSETSAADVRIGAFGCLAVSAKQNGSLLEDNMVDAIYSLISSKSTDKQLQSAAAAAFGALNLPSRKVKNLILDQAKK